MRLAVVSDIHGNLPALQAVAADALALGHVDGWLNLGDTRAAAQASRSRSVSRRP